LIRLGVLAVLWGSGFLWVKLALRGLSPTQLVLGQLVAGALVLLGAALLGPTHGLPRSPVSWAHVAVMAIVANIAPYLLYGWAQQYVASSLAGALNATTPLFTPLLAMIIGSERPSLTRALGIVIGFVGFVGIVVGARRAGWRVRRLTVGRRGVPARPGLLRCLLCLRSPLLDPSRFRRQPARW
jgi:drug/metabolite transporter (DMT)-like permease